MQQSHDAMVPGEACAHHKNAHTTNEGGDVAHVGEAVPGKQKEERNWSQQLKPEPVLNLQHHVGHRYFVKDTHSYARHTGCLRRTDG